MRVLIDRFEGDFAVCEKEDRTMLNIKLTMLPANAKEGDVLVIEGNTVGIDDAETEKKKIAAEKLVENVWRDNAPENPS